MHVDRFKLVRVRSNPVPVAPGLGALTSVPVLIRCMRARLELHCFGPVCCCGSAGSSAIGFPWTARTGEGGLPVRRKALSPSRLAPVPVRPASTRRPVCSGFVLLGRVPQPVSVSFPVTFRRFCFPLSWYDQKKGLTHASIGLFG